MLENAERPTTGKEIINNHPLEQIQKYIARGAVRVKVNNIVLQPILSERVPVIKTPMIAKACTSDSAPPANHRLSPLAVRYVGKYAPRTEAEKALHRRMPAIEIKSSF